MAQRVAEHAAAGVLTGVLVAALVRLLRIRVSASWTEIALMGGCTAILFTIADGKPTDLVWSAGVAAAAAVLYVFALMAIQAVAKRGHPTSGT